MRFQDLQKRELVLECVEGEEKGKIYVLDFLEKYEEFSIGRADFHDVVLSDMTVSLRHCKINYGKETGWVLREDATAPSFFGTFVYLCNFKQLEAASESYPQMLPSQGMLNFSNYDVFFKKGIKKRGDKNYNFTKKAKDI